MLRSFTLEGGDALEAILHDTLQRGKQLLVFVNTRRRAEATAERLARLLPRDSSLQSLAEDILHALETPTRQCERLARLIPHGVGFHHAGLAARQKHLLEEAFRTARLKVLVATPTLAAGVDLPAFRVVILDASRYADGWQQPLSMLDYLQMAGRAGRPAYDDHGEAYLIARDEQHAEALAEAFFQRDVEDVQSKLGVQPTLRRIILGLLSMGYTREEELFQLLSGTLYAQQYAQPLHSLVQRVIQELQQAGFIEDTRVEDDFIPADQLASQLRLTRLGKRVAELYIDPLTAMLFLQHLPRVTGNVWQSLVLLSLATEARPLPSVKRSEEDSLWEALDESTSRLVADADDPLRVVKHARILHAWMNEESEEALYEAYGVTPGELAQRRLTADWLAYALAELARLQGLDARFYQQLRMRIAFGVRDDLLTLVSMRGIGRKRARLLARHGFRSREDILSRREEAERLLGRRLVERILSEHEALPLTRERQSRLHGWQKQEE